MSEAIEIVQKINEDFDKAEEKLDKITETANEKTGKVLDLLNGKTDIFNEPSDFYSALNNLAEEIGHSTYVVLEIEMRRMGLTPKETEENPKKTGAALQPITIQTSPPQQLGVFSGGWHYLAERSKAKSAIEAIKIQVQNPPQISTTKQVIDILDFGRQQIPEYVNRTIKYYEQCLAHLRFFDDKVPKTKEIFLSNLREHLNKLAAIIRAFCRTVAEYRTELIGERKRDIAKAIIALKMAETAALTGRAPSFPDMMGQEMRKRVE